MIGSLGGDNLLQRSLELADSTTGYAQGPGGFYRKEDRSGPYSISADGVATLITKESQSNYVPKGDDQIAIADLSAARGLSVPAGATVAILQNNTSVNLRWRDSGAGNPTATLGQRLPPGRELTYDGALSQLKIIRETDGTGTLDVWYGSF